MKRSYHHSPFARKGLFSGLAFFSFSAIGVFPVLSQIDPGVFTLRNSIADVVETSDRGIGERCRWQEDRELLSSIQDNKRDTFQTGVPCEQKSVPVMEPTEGVPIHQDNALRDAIREMTAGYPVEAMALAISQYDRGVAGLIVGIAKKESNWGKRVPVDADGADCFNYWGYKGAGSRGVEMGHGCFGSPEEAVTAVGDRLKYLVTLRDTSEPKHMVIWKCGSSCATHTPESVDKWISDVSIYYDRIALR
ncbi:MAG: hypothetical protein WAW00_01565 [Candidatus Moraniibacteriota bacterium]